MKYGIIGGTGVYTLKNKEVRKEIKTPYGSIDITVVKVGEDEIVFLPRHGKGHKLPPHKVNYKGNMWALKEYGVEKVFATAAVGSLKKEIKIGDLVVINDFIDFTKDRGGTFFEEEVAHVSMADPYCKDLRMRLKEKGLSKEGIYVCTEGPRFETAAEIRFYASIGGDVVGMTNVPELVLAKELGLCYACVGIITNMCTGLVDEEATGEEIVGIVDVRKEELTKIFIEIFKEDKDKDNIAACNCKEALIRV